MYSAPLVAERERDDDGRGSAGIECRSRREPVGVASGPRRKKCICIWSTRETASALDNYETRWASREPLNMPVWGVQVAEKPAGEAAIRHVVCAEFFFFFFLFFSFLFYSGGRGWRAAAPRAGWRSNRLHLLVECGSVGSSPLANVNAAAPRELPAPRFAWVCVGSLEAPLDAQG